MVVDTQLRIVVDRPQKGFLYIEARDLNNSPVFVRVKQLTPSLTSVRIRAGMIGNESYSSALMSHVGTHLAAQVTDGPRIQ
jgi:hypothetical protein